MAYTIPKKEVRAMHFAYICVFGMKEPIFSEHHLSLCDDMTLLLLRKDDECKPLLLHKVRQGKFYVSLEVGSPNLYDTIIIYVCEVYGFIL